jgi:hypothetical protein
MFEDKFQGSINKLNIFETNWEKFKEEFVDAANSSDFTMDIKFDSTLPVPDKPL